MPYKTEKIPYDDPFLEKMSKLLPCQKEMIHHYRNEGWSQRQLAAHFNVSRRQIQFILDPKKQEANYQKRLEKGGSKQYYDKEYNTKSVRESRNKKHKILKNTIK